MMRSAHNAITPRWLVLLFLIVAALSPGGPARADDKPSSPEAVLHLMNGDFLPGHLTGVEDATVMSWQSRLFAKPLQFPLDRVSSVIYAAAAEPQSPGGEYCFELGEGDILYGSLLGITDDHVELDVPRFGRLHVRRDSVCRIYPRRSRALVYDGPEGLPGWKQAATNPWREDNGYPFTDRPDAFLFRDFKIPALAAIEFILSWKTKPDFVLALDVDEQPATIQRAFRFEVWDSDLVVHRETESEADVVSVQQIAPGPGRAHLHAFLDRQNGHLTVFSPTGAKLADLQFAPREAQTSTGLWLVNKRGDIRLDRLRINSWSGTLPQDVQHDRSRLHRTDGSLVSGQLVAFDAATKIFTLRNGEIETRITAEQIASIYLSPVTSASARPLRATLQDGTQLSGELTQIADDHLALTDPTIREPLRLPLAELRSLTVLHHRSGPASLSVPNGQSGTLQLDGVQLRGQLVDGEQQPDSSCLVWLPEQSRTASPLRPGVSGRIVYREPPPTAPAPTGRTQPMQQAQPVIIRDGVRVVLSKTQLPAPAPARGTRSLHLRSGDMFPCEVERIDEKGITFKTPLLDTTFVSHDKIKAVELTNIQSAMKLNKAKQERLLTLPRRQKDSPPTQLICSSNGDFLRGRVLDMDDTKLRVEIRLETRELPRDRVSQIIWLHADESDDSEPASKPPDPSIEAAGTRVQVLRSDGIRLSFDAEQFAAQTLCGTSAVLGACQADLSQVDQLVFGDAIDKAAAQLPYHQWKLHGAVDPKFVESDDQSGSDRVPGTESSLVGKVAPDFELGLIGGGSFHLAACKGKIVVLDFWASWCGPCLRTMPLVENVVQEFEGKVQLIAVNLEEPEQQITAAMERYKLELTAALDRDGTVAAKYSVTAIPQTVVIDQSGKIARLFVGGGPNIATQLREALQGLVTDAD